MLIGLPKEIKDNEDRVGLTPAGVRALTEQGHSVVVQAGAGVGSSFEDDAYIDAGAEIVSDASKVFERADMIVKVKEPLPSEYALLKDGSLPVVKSSRQGITFRLTVPPEKC